MSSRFHQKYHRYNHHSIEPGSTSDPRYPDAGYDPIASFDAPFQGEFYSEGSIITTQNLSAKKDLGVEQNGIIGNNLLVGHDLTVNNDFRVLGNAIVDENLYVYGDRTHLDTEVWVLSNAFFQEDLYVGGNINGFGTFTLSGAALLKDTLTVEKDCTFNKDLYVAGNLTVDGDSTILYTNAYVTSSVNIYNKGTDTGLTVTQTGTQSIAHFIDAEGGEVIIGNNGIITAPAIILLAPHTHTIIPSKTVTLPISSIDIEINTTVSTCISAFNGGVPNIQYTLTNVGTVTLMVTSTSYNNIYIRTGNSWRSNTCSLTSAFLELPPNHSCSLRKSSTNKISIW